MLKSILDITDGDEFVLLYELKNPKEIDPFWKYNKFDLDNMDEAQCKRKFCFLHSHVYDLENVFRENSYSSEDSKLWT